MKGTNPYTGRFEGQWWLPGKEENAIQGTLDVLDDGEIFFQTMHQFDRSNPLFGVAEYNELHGLVKSEVDNRDYFVLLFDLLQVHKTTSRLSRTRFFVHKALIGGSDCNISVNYNELILSSEVFSDWVKGTGLKIEENGNSNKLFPTVSYTKPEPIDLFFHNGITAGILFWWHHSCGPGRTIKIAERPVLKLKLDEPENIENILALMACVNRFLMVLFEQYHIFNFIEVNADLKGRYRLLGSRYIQKTTDRITFDFDEFVTSGAQYYINWIEIYEKFNLAIRTFFFAFADYKIDIHSRFLNYVFALEQLHRMGFRDNEPLSKTNKKMYERAMQIKEGDLKSWLEKVLSKNRDIHLKTRLKELCEFAELKEAKRISPEEITRIIKNRQYLVHLDEKDKKEVFSVNEVYHINHKLESLFFQVLKKNMNVKFSAPKT
jgi:hypothetical protein